MKVRSAESRDLPELVRLLDELDEFYGDEPTESAAHRSSAVTQALFATPPLAHALVAETDDGSLAGFAAYSFLWPAVGSTASLYLKELYVMALARRSGVGRALFQELCAIADRLDLSRIELTTDRSNVDAQEFYRQLEIPTNGGKIFYRLEGDQLHALSAQ